MIEAPDANRDVLLKYVESKTEIAPQSNGARRFAPWPSAVVASYLTSPAAVELPAPPGLKLTTICLARAASQCGRPTRPMSQTPQFRPTAKRSTGPIL